MYFLLYHTCHVLFAQLDPLTLHDQPKSEDDCGTCSARLLMDQGRIVHTGGNWKLTSSVAEDTHTSDICKKNMNIMLSNNSLCSSNGSEVIN